MVLSELIKNNLRRLIRSKGALIALVLAPLILMVVAAMAFDSQNTYDLHIGTYSKAYSKDANQFVQNLEDNSFQVTRFRSSTQCTDALKLGTVVTCLVFTKEPNDEVAMYVDSSKINLVDSLLSLMAQRLSEQSSLTGANITANLVQRMEDARAGLEESRPIIVSLTTHNEQSTQKVNDLLSQLHTLKLKINQSIDNSTLEAEDNRFIEWLTSLSGMVDDIISEYSNTFDVIREEVDTIAMSETDKQTLLQILTDGEESLGTIKDKIEVTGKVSQKDLDDVLELTTETLQTFDNIQAELDTLHGFKSDGITKLRGIKASLDQNLLKFIQLQNALNKIDKSITAKQLEDPQNLIAPLSVRVEPITTATKRFELLFPTLLMLVIMFSSIIISSTLMVMHKNSPVALRNKVTPVKHKEFELGMLLTSLIIVGAQVLLILAVGLAYFGVDLALVLPATLGIAAVAIATFSLLGMVLGAFFASESSSLFVGVIGSSVLMILSDIILPLESFPIAIRQILLYNPLVLGIYSIKRIILFHSPISFVTKEIIIFGIYILVLVGLLSLIHKKYLKYNKSYKRQKKS